VSAVPPAPTFNSEVTVETPDSVRLVAETSAAVTSSTVIDGVPESEDAVVAVPVTAPTNVVAVTTPETLIFAGSLSLSIVPVRLDAFNAPLKLVAVITPDALIPPVELIPTQAPLLFGLDPTWKVLRGSVVPTPTFPAA